MEPCTNSNDLFERYLHAVGKHLPWQRQDDIVAELRANLEVQREEREAALGRPLTEGEMIDWLKELGPPVRMAARYQPARYLIGPAIFPLYLQILRIVLLWATVAYAVATVVRTFTEPHAPEWIAQALLGYPQLLFSAAACVTIAFAILEVVSERYPEKCPPCLASSPNWSPTSLHPVEKEPALKGKPRTLTTAVANFVVGFAVLVWLLLLPSYPFLVLGPGAAYLHHSPFQFAPVVVWFYWAVVGLNAFQLIWQGYNLLADMWRTKHPLHTLATKAHRSHSHRHSDRRARANLSHPKPWRFRHAAEWDSSAGGHHQPLHLRLLRDHRLHRGHRLRRRNVEGQQNSPAASVPHGSVVRPGAQQAVMGAENN